ncbi:MAG: hypothetical protein R6U36_04440, partial [Candidatus Fermentibacteraceae bacterium]
MRPVPAAVPLLLLLFLASCSLFPEETSAPPPRPPLPDSPSLTGIDSLLMYGRPDAARRLLLEGLDRGEIGSADALVRLLGSYHCRGREDLALQLLDSLESAGWGPLTGWKVSLLDMARRPEEALELAGADRPLLRLWLMRDLPDSLRMEGVMVLPPPKGAVERMVRAEATPPGGLTRRQLEVAAADAAVMPLLRERVLLELEKLLYSPGDLWERAYTSMGGDGAQLLLARRLAAMDAGRQRLEEVLEAGGEAAAVAAEELLLRWPAIYGESWSLADILCSNDRCGLAEGMTGPGVEERGDLSLSFVVIVGVELDDQHRPGPLREDLRDRLELGGVAGEVQQDVVDHLDGRRTVFDDRRDVAHRVAEGVVR